MTTLIHPIIVAVALPQGSVARLIERVSAIVEAMAANPTSFPTPSPPLAVVRAHLAGLVASHADFQTHKAPITDRLAWEKLVVGDVSQLHSYVEAVVNASPPEQAAAIAGQAAMALRKKTLVHKPPLAIKQGVSGSIRILAQAVQGAVANYWQYSVDGGQHWLDLPPTTPAKTKLHGIIPNTLVTVRHRALTRKGLGDFGDPVTLRVL